MGKSERLKEQKKLDEAIEKKIIQFGRRAKAEQEKAKRAQAGTGYLKTGVTEADLIPGKCSKCGGTEFYQVFTMLFIMSHQAVNGQQAQTPKPCLRCIKNSCDGVMVAPKPELLVKRKKDMPEWI